MREFRLFFCLLIVLMVYVSGCTQTIAGSNEGVRIVDFSFDSPSVSDREQTELTLEIENVGSVDVDHLSFYLYGYDEDVFTSSSVDVTAGDTVNSLWAVSDLRSYDAENHVAGQTAGYYNLFNVADSAVADGMTRKYNFYGRLCYGYETLSYATIEAISYSEKRAESIGSSKTTIDITNSYSPIQVEVKTNSPLVFYSTSAGQQAELALILRNVGGGFVASGDCRRDVGVETLNQLTSLDVTLDGDVLTCDEGPYYFYDDMTVVYCTYVATDPRPKATYMLNVELNYNYYNDLTASINVVGNSRGSLIDN